MNASEGDSVIFVGNGATGAIHKLIHALDFKQPPVSVQIVVSTISSFLLSHIICNLKTAVTEFHEVFVILLHNWMGC